jgi:MFS family permease
MSDNQIIEGGVPDVNAQKHDRKFVFSARPRITFLLCTIYALMYLDRVNISAAASSIKASFKLSNTQMGVAFSGFSWAYLLTVLVGGWAARRYGARLVLIFCAALLGMATISTAFVSGIASLFLVRLLVGAGEGPAFPAATQAMRNWYPQSQFGYIQGITHSFSRLGAAIAPPLVAILIVMYGWRTSFVVCGVAVLIWAVVWWFQFCDDPREHAAVVPRALIDVNISLPNRVDRTPFGALTKRMIPVTMVMFTYGWTYWIFVSWLPLYFINRYHVDLKTSGFLTSVPFLTGMVGNFVGGILSDIILRRTKNSRLARCGVVAFSLATCALALTFVVEASELPVALISLAIAMFCLELTIAPMFAVPMDISIDFAGLGSAFVVFGVAVAGIASPILFGWLIDATGNWNLPFTTAVGVLVIGAAASFLVRPDRPFVPPLKEGVN